MRIGPAFLPLILAALVLPIQAGGQTRPAPEAGDLAAILAGCAQDQLPGMAAACVGRLANPCIDALSVWSLKAADNCWSAEARAWGDWGRGARSEALARLEMASPGSAGRAAELADAWLGRIEDLCALHRLAWPGDDDGVLMAAQCRAQQTAAWAQFLDLLGRA